MARLVAEIKEPDRAEIHFNIFSGGNKGIMMQVTQGIGTIISMDTPGFIQLTHAEAIKAREVLDRFIKGDL